ncbi:SH3 domain-containing protein [Massilia sp. DWR3-1-1]|uniref:SH3 domain-containing protein n=1 Tax=Massilia sp. DWR3-1-1 TaxID=2804559 RepID=UPI003CF532FA
MPRSRFAVLIALLLALPVAAAVDFKSIGAAPAILYDAPSTRGGKLYVAPRGMPVEVVLSYGAWVKLRDMNGDMAWAEASALSPRRTLVVRSANAKVRAGAEDNAAVVMTADRGVLLELVEPAPASIWLKVRHKDGMTGFVKATDVWGI